MTSNQAVEEIIKSIRTWQYSHSKLVIAIEGIPGVGKSTIMDLMEGKIDALLVHMDDFLAPIDYRQKLVDSGASSDELVAGLFDYKDIRDLIEKYRSDDTREYKTLAYKSGKRQIERVHDLTKPILVIEGTYLNNTQYFENLWDKTIYLYGDEEEIKQRRIARTKKLMGDKFIPEDDPRSFFSLGLKAFKEYLDKYKPKEKANLVLYIANNI